MWTEITREQYRREGLRYASDMTAEEWALIEVFMPPPRRLGRPRTTRLRDVVEASLYVLTTGCQWRLLPKEFPPFSTVQRFFYRWRAEGLWERINHALLMVARERVGREASPSAGVAAEFKQQCARICESPATVIQAKITTMPPTGASARRPTTKAGGATPPLRAAPATPPTPSTSTAPSVR